MNNLFDRKTLIQQAALTAGKFMKSAHPTNGKVHKEGRGNFFTDADLTCEKMIMDLIRKHFPDDQILSEETSNLLPDILSIDHLWVIDPIDGTNNFSNQRNYSCVSIGYVENGVTKLGAVYNPFVDEFFFAEKGKGAFVNDNKMQISQQTDITQACVCTDNSYTPSITKYHLQLLLQIEPTPFILMKGSAALIMCDIAAGRVDLYFTTAISPWDNAAAFLMIEEAGGVIKNFSNERVTFNTKELIVGNKNMVNDFISLVKQKTS
jgi:myo-inositol-1(or 4)-monophosphatase